MHWATPEERAHLGQTRRKQVGRQQHCECNPKTRKTAPLTLLDRSMRGRVPELVKLKYQLMSVSPFGYFRGAVPVMAADLAALPNTGLVAQLCGDAHVRNVGAYAAPDGRLVFDINDFDETIRGPFEWDLKRMAASIVLAGRESGHKDAANRRAAELCIEHYCAMMRNFAELPLIEVGRHQVRLGQVEPIHDALVKAEHATPQHTLAQLTEPRSNKPASKAAAPGKAVPGEASPDRRFKEIPPMLKRVSPATATAVIASLTPYKQELEPQRQHLFSLYRPIDVAFKVVGTGSVGLRDYVIYFEGNGPADPLFLQIKEEPNSAYTAYLPDAHPQPQNGQRVAEGQKAMQLQSDPFLGWTRIGNRDYLVRQLNDHKGSIEIDDLAGGGLEAFAEVCGELLARGHARSSDPGVLAGYLGSGDGFAEGVAKFGESYADQTEKDWQELKRSGKAGKPPKLPAKAAQSARESKSE
jgi:uncharacterized protein (DUF2252 family)